ncbi:MAG TPA: glycosyltransferase family 4 protein [Streptosporangiaceae bacterium]|nr:glycosyltransferase family 4 protein [Streptosporangiaceae bacterium]
MTAPRVAFVLGTTSGGTGRHVAMLAWGCGEAGELAGVFGPEGSRALLESAGVGFEPVAIADRPRPASDLAAVRRLRRLLAGARADVVHAHGLRAGALAALALGAGAAGDRPGLIVTVHNAPPAGARLAAIYGVLERIVARRADVVLCVSSDLEARMRGLGARRVERAVVPAAMLDGPFAPADLGASERPVVLGVGRLAPQKGFETLIDAAWAWSDRKPRPLVVIAGEGPLAGELSSRAQKLGVDVRFLGSRSDVTALFAAADVFVLPSRWEGQPLILQEALRAGRPIVATDVGGVRDLTGDEAVLLVPPGDPEALARAVLSVLDDAEFARRLGAAAESRGTDLPFEQDAIAAALALYRNTRRGRV